MEERDGKGGCSTFKRTPLLNPLPARASQEEEGETRVIGFDAVFQV
jgi:hypothetical protein